MTLQSSGAISLGDLQTEYGGANPVSVNEYYRDGAYVPSTISADGTISNASYSGSTNSSTGSIWWRADLIGAGSRPVYNSSGNYMMYYSYWTDGEWTSGTGWVDFTCTADYSGEYMLEWSCYNTGASRSRTLYLNGTQIHSSTSNSGTYSFTVSGGDTIRIYSTMSTIGNYNSHTIYLKANGGGTQLSSPANTNVPTSGEVSMDDFYSGQKSL